MLARIIGWSLQHRMLVLLGTFLVLAAGGFALSRLNIDAFPDTTPVQVQINTAVPALVPEEIEPSILGHANGVASGAVPPEPAVAFPIIAKVVELRVLRKNDGRAFVSGFAVATVAFPVVP